MITLADPATAHPRHHPDVELLLDYVALGGVEPESLVIATHLAFCAECRRAVGDLRRIGGAMLDALKPARLPPNMLNRTLAAIERDCATPTVESRQDVAAAPIARIERVIAQGPWRHVPGGFSMAGLTPDSRASRVWLLKAARGMTMLRHRHVGDEWTLVLKGGFADETGRYAPGDFVSLGETVEHQPMIDRDGDCLCLFLVRATPRYSGLVGRLAQSFIRF
jgi:putative transcriptional regulator